eukprot:6584086-Prymnesium_polylepis.1
MAASDGWTHRAGRNVGGRGETGTDAAGAVSAHRRVPTNGAATWPSWRPTLRMAAPEGAAAAVQTVTTGGRAVHAGR